MGDAAAPVLSFALGTVGSIIGGPVGYVIGSTIGRILGNALFPPDPITQEGPRISDLSGQTSAYGKAIPIGYGQMRVGGNVTWLQGDKLIERKIVRTQSSGGGKGGGGGGQETRTVEYRYYASFRVSLAEATGDKVLKIWADTKLIYDATGTTTVKKGKGWKFRIYPGGLDQGTDFLEDADRGTSPAYRGQFTIVFDYLQLKNFGNRIPQISCLVAFEGENQKTYPSNTYSNISNFNGTYMTYDAVRKTLVVLNTTEDKLYKVNVPSMTATRSSTDTSYVSNLKIITIDENTGYIIARYGSSNNTPIVAIDPNSFTEVYAFPPDKSTSIIGENREDTFAYLEYATPVTMKQTNTAGGGVQSFILTSSIFDDAGILSSSLEYVWGFEQMVDENVIGPPFVGNPTDDPETANEEIIKCYWTGLTSTQFSIYKTNLRSYAEYVGDDGSGNPRSIGVDDLSLFVRLTPSDISGFDDQFSYVTSFSDENLWSVDDEVGQLVGVLKTNGNPVVVSIDDTSGAINWITELDSGTTVWGGKLGDRSQNLTASPYFVVSYSNKVDLINKYTGEYELQTTTNDVATWNTTGQWDQGWFYDPDLDAILGKPTSLSEAGIIFLNRVAESDGVTLKQIMDDLCVRANLEATDYDNTELSDTSIRGYFISREMPIRSAIEPLASAYFYDVIELDHKIQSLDRGRANTFTITQQDLADVGKTKEPFPITRITEQELPMRITVSYVDVDRDYQVGSQYDKRMQNPTTTMYSVNEVSKEFAIAMDKDEAVQVASKFLHTAWKERDLYQFETQNKFLVNTVADVGTITLDNGAQYTARISEMNIGHDFTLRVKGISEDIASYTSNKTSSSGSDISQPLEDVTSASFVKIHQLPLLNDFHSQGRSFSLVYVQGAPQIANSPWAGANFFLSFDNGVTWEYATNVSEAMTYGSIEGTLADPVSSPFDIDTVSTLKIWPINGGDELTTITEDEFLSGTLNNMRVGNEVVVYRDVTDNGDGSYTLSRFLRGRRGTDVYSTGHASDELFYSLTTDTVSAFTVATSNLNQTALYKIVGADENFEDVSAVSITFTGEDLKPYAPVNAVRTDDDPSAGDIKISWDRRTRLYGSWEDDYGQVPLEEDSESYEVAILNASGGDEVETLTSDREFATFASADVIYHFGGQPTTLYCRIYQISGQVNRGFSYEFALTV